ncbi:MAG: hypothetical protein MHM6MM_004813 [Cercozoa sp. M6MM]
MRLIAHSQLICTRCRFAGGLKLAARSVEEVEADFSADFMARFLERLKGDKLRSAVDSLVAAGVDATTVAVPETLPETATAADEPLLRRLHHVLLELDVLEGDLTCPSCARVYNIRQAIPNMLLNEDEVDFLEKRNKKVRKQKYPQNEDSGSDDESEDAMAED